MKHTGRWMVLPLLALSLLTGAVAQADPFEHGGYASPFHHVRGGGPGWHPHHLDIDALARRPLVPWLSWRQAGLVVDCCRYMVFVRRSGLSVSGVARGGDVAAPDGTGGSACSRGAGSAGAVVVFLPLEEAVLPVCGTLPGRLENGTGHTAGTLMRQKEYEHENCCVMDDATGFAQRVGGLCHPADRADCTGDCLGAGQAV
ncbi:hypothetical protein [Paludibacterium denitrificans]|uniref:hypothetical protein n=1 Tax=Paludibacterium denitrificans TaxID=2675226 RepID=UPI001E5F752B|nr:hypothetical protein [Paludibacterium denitrificans]